MPEATIRIHTHFSFMQGAFRGRNPSISIDGGELQESKWGDSSHTVQPGEHTVYIEVNYALGKKVGKASTSVNVGAGETVGLRYRPPLLVFMKGKLKRSN